MNTPFTQTANFKKNTRLLLLILLPALALLEILAYYQKGLFTVEASRVWMITAFAYLALCGYAVYKTLIKDIREKSWLSLGILALITVICFWGVGNVRMNALNDEATQQIADGLAAFKMPDWNYIGTAYDTGLGYGLYPCRQFLLMGLPSLVFGRTPFALQIGFCFSQWLGFMMFYAGMRRYCVEKLKLQPVFPALVMLAFLSFPYFANYMFVRDQAILPAAFIMQGIGWYCLLRLSKKPANFFAFAWISAMLATSFTAGLAGWGLALAVLALLFLQNKKRDNAAFAATFIYITVFGVCSYLMLQSLGAGMAAERGSFAQDMTGAMNMFFLGDPMPYISPVFSLLVAVYMALSLCFLLGMKNFISAWWVLATIFVAVNFKGSGLSRTEHTMLRTIIIVPVLTSMMSVTGARLLKRFLPKREPPPEEPLKKARLLTSIPLLRINKSTVITLLALAVILCNAAWGISRPNQWDHYKQDESRVDSLIAVDIQRVEKEPAGKQVIVFKAEGRCLLNRIVKYTSPGIHVIYAELAKEGAPVPEGFDPGSCVAIYADTNGVIPDELISRYGQPEIIEYGNGRLYKRLVVKSSEQQNAR